MQRAIGRTAPLGKNQHRNAVLAYDVGRARKRLDRCAGIFSRHRDMSRAREMSPEKRDLEQPLLGEEPELNRNIAQDHGRVHVTQVIGNEDVAGVGIDFFKPFDLHPHAREPQDRTRPRARQLDLRVAALFKQRDHNADRSAKNRRNHDQRIDDQKAPDQSHPFIVRSALEPPRPETAIR